MRNGVHIQQNVWVICSNLTMADPSGSLPPCCTQPAFSPWYSTLLTHTLLSQVSSIFGFFCTKIKSRKTQTSFPFCAKFLFVCEGRVADKQTETERNKQRMPRYFTITNRNQQRETRTEIKMKHWKGELQKVVMVDEKSWEKWDTSLPQKVIWAVVELAQLRYYCVFTWMRRSNWGGVRVEQNDSGRNRCACVVIDRLDRWSAPFSPFSVLDVWFCVHISPAMRLMVVRMKHEMDMFSYRGQQDTQTTQKEGKKTNNPTIVYFLPCRLASCCFLLSPYRNHHPRTHALFVASQALMSCPVVSCFLSSKMLCVCQRSAYVREREASAPLQRMLSTWSTVIIATPSSSSGRKACLFASIPSCCCNSTRCLSFVLSFRLPPRTRCYDLVSF